MQQCLCDPCTETVAETVVICNSNNVAAISFHIEVHTQPAESVQCMTVHSFIHSDHFYNAPSSPLPLRGAPDYSMDTVSEFHAEAHRQLQVKDLPKVPRWRLERESNPRPSG